MQTLWSGKYLGVIGGGNMAEALLRGILASQLISPQAIIVHDPLAERRHIFSTLGCRTATTAAETLSSDVILLATKPQNLRDALKGLELRPDQVLASILAGVATTTIQATLPGSPRVVRAMPNTPLLVGMGMTGLAKGAHASATDMARVLALFACCGDAVEVAEADLDAVTALSGSGPAYLFRFAEALMQAGEEMGLTPALAKRLTIGMVRGAAEMLSRDGDAAALRQRVTSPGGTTAAALAVFEAKDFTGLTSSALNAAQQRSRELGREST